MYFAAFALIVPMRYNLLCLQLPYTFKIMIVQALHNVLMRVVCLLTLFYGTDLYENILINIP